MRILTLILALTATLAHADEPQRYLRVEVVYVRPGVDKATGTKGYQVSRSPTHWGMATVWDEKSFQHSFVAWPTSEDWAEFAERVSGWIRQRTGGE